VTKEELVYSKNQKYSQIQTNKANLSSVDTQLSDVQSAKEKIKEHKDSAKEIYNTFKKLPYNDKSNWKGTNRNNFKECNFQRSKEDFEHYIDGLDDMLDALVDKEKKLIDEKNDYCIIIEQLNDAWNWLTGQIEKLVN